MRTRVLAVGAVLGALLISTVGTAPVALAGGDPNGGSSSHGDAKSLPASNHVTGHYPPSCKAVGKLPDPKCTPGSASDAVTQNNIKTTICVNGYTDKVRPPGSETSRLKTVAMKAYGYPSSARAQIQLDHLIPLEAGGSSDVSNLWPQRDPKNYRAKDKIEDQLHAAICSGKVKLAVAQSVISGDWTTALHKAGIG